MIGDEFGSLLDWGRVISQITSLKARGKLDDYQTGLRRILRYPHNWRLREAAIGAIPDVKEPSDALIDEARAVMRDGNIYWEARALVADALSQLSCEMVGRSEMVHRIIADMRAIIRRPQPPLFHAAVRQSLEAVLRRPASWPAAPEPSEGHEQGGAAQPSPDTRFVG